MDCAAGKQEAESHKALDPDVTKREELSPGDRRPKKALKRSTSCDSNGPSETEITEKAKTLNGRPQSVDKKSEGEEGIISKSVEAEVEVADEVESLGSLRNASQESPGSEDEVSISLTQS